MRLRKGRERRRAGSFIAEGPREVERAISAGLAVREVFFAPELLADWAGGIATSDAARGRVQEVSARVLAKLSYRAEPEGVIAIVEIPQRELPAESTLLLVAVGIEKPGNLGAM